MRIKAPGYTIIESLIALAMLGVFGAVAGQIVVTMSNSDKIINQFSESVILVSSVAEALKDDAVCMANVGGRNPTASPSIPSIAFGGQTLVSAGQTILPQNIRVNSIVISDYISFSGTSDMGVATLDIEMDLLRGNSIVYTRVLPLFMEVKRDGAGNISACKLSGTGGVLEAICNGLGGTLVAGRCNALNITGNLNGVGNIHANNLQVLGPSGISANSITNTGTLTASSATASSMVFNGSANTGSMALGGVGRFHTVTSAGNICVGGVCRNFATTSCPGGQHGYGITAGGAIMCRPNPPPPPPPPPPPMPP